MLATRMTMMVVLLTSLLTHNAVTESLIPVTQSQHYSLLHLKEIAFNGYMAYDSSTFKVCYSNAYCIHIWLSSGRVTTVRMDSEIFSSRTYCQIARSSGIRTSVASCSYFFSIKGSRSAYSLLPKSAKTNDKVYHSLWRASLGRSVMIWFLIIFKQTSEALTKPHICRWRMEGSEPWIFRVPACFLVRLVIMLIQGPRVHREKRASYAIIAPPRGYATRTWSKMSTI